MSIMLICIISYVMFFDLRIIKCSSVCLSVCMLNFNFCIFQCAAVAITIWQIVEEIREFRRSNESHEVSWVPYEPRSEKTGLPDFRPGPTQTGLYSHGRWLEA